jgi:hypothetical protein
MKNELINQILSIIIQTQGISDLGGLHIDEVTSLISKRVRLPKDCKWKLLPLSLERGEVQYPLVYERWKPDPKDYKEKDFHPSGFDKEFANQKTYWNIRWYCCPVDYDGDEHYSEDWDYIDEQYSLRLEIKRALENSPVYGCSDRLSVEIESIVGQTHAIVCKFRIYGGITGEMLCRSVRSKKQAAI